MVIVPAVNLGPCREEVHMQNNGCMWSEFEWDLQQLVHCRTVEVCKVRER